MRGCQGGHAWLPGGMCGWQGTCVVGGGACIVARGACMVAGGACVVVGGVRGCWGGHAVAGGHAC